MNCVPPYVFHDTDGRLYLYYVGGGVGEQAIGVMNLQQ